MDNNIEKFIGYKTIHHVIFYDGKIQNIGDKGEQFPHLVKTTNYRNTKRLTKESALRQFQLGCSYIKMNSRYGGIIKTPEGKFYEVEKSYKLAKMIPLEMVRGKVLSYNFS